jgi:hypothetical protein
MSSKFLRKRNFACRLRVLQLFTFLGGLALLTGSNLVTYAQYSNVPVTGFNADIVADGLGSPASASTTTAVDGGSGTGFVFVSPTFGPVATPCVPGAGVWPSANQITSTNTTTGTGITYQLQAPGAGVSTNNNTLKLANGNSGMLTLATPVPASNLYFVCLGGGGAVAFSATVTYADATTETITPAASAPDWCGGAATYKVTTQAYYRILSNSITCDGAACPYIYEIPAAIGAANYGKNIVSVTFNNLNTSGTAFLHILALGRKAPCTVPAIAPAALNFTDSTFSAITGAFTIGDASNYLVVRYPAGSTPVHPVNGVPYTVGSALGAGTIVSAGTANTFTATGLNASTGYSFYVYGYNTGTTCGGPVYNTVPATGTQSTKSCPAAITAGTIASTAATVCPSTTFTLSLTGADAGPSITYQWQGALTGTGLFANLTGGTSATYTGTQSAATDYRCILTCGGSTTDTTPVMTIAQNAITTCYCQNSYSNTTSGYITNFTTTGGAANISNSSTNQSGGYQDFTGQVVSGVAPTAISFTATTFGTNRMAIFIDWNQDGDFMDAGETVYTQNTTYASSFNGSFTIPPAAIPGHTRMRVRVNWNGNVTDACAAYSAGETEDYTFNVIAQAPCTGVPAPGNTIASASSHCVSGTSSLSVDNGYIYFSGVNYQWQSSGDGTVWHDVTGGTAATFTTPVLTQTTSYRLRVICTNGPDTAYSTAKTIVVHPLPAVFVSPAQGAICTNGSLMLVADGAATYTWAPATGLSATTGAIVDASPASTTTYTVTGTDANGCVNTAMTTVSPITEMKPMVTGVDACTPNTAAVIAITPITAMANAEYQLTDTSGAVVGAWQTSNVFYITLATAGSHKYFVLARLAACNTIFSDTAVVQVNAGFEATVVSNAATCANNDGSLVVTNPVGPGTDNTFTWYANDFSGAALNPAQATLSGNASINGGRGVITPSATSSKGGLTIRNPGGITTNALTVTFDMTADNVINNFGTGGADGIAYSFGDDATYSNSITNGAGSKLRVVFDAASNGTENSNHAGVYITYGYSSNIQMGDASAGVLAHSTNVDWKVSTDKPVSIVITETGKLTLTWNGTVLFSDIQLPPAYLAANKTTWKHLFSAFTGGDAMRFAIDNLNIRYGTETFSYGATPGNSNMVPSTWQASNTFSGLSSSDSLDIWIANPSNPAICHRKLGTFGVASTLMTSLLTSAHPSCVATGDGYVRLKVPVAGTYSAAYNKNGGGTITQTGLVSANDGTNEYIEPSLAQGVYTNFRVTDANTCVSNAIAGQVTLVAPTVDSIAMTSAVATAATQPGAGIQYYTNNNCALIAAITSPNNLGQVTAALTVNNTAGISPGGEPFVGRSYAIIPGQNTTLGANVKLYFTAADFAAYNASPAVGTSAYPAIAANGSNLRIRVFHGLPASGTTGPDGTYDVANSDTLQPAGIVWNTAGNFWEVDVFTPNGFSGFYANTAGNIPLNITLGNITAHNEGAVNIVNWDTRSESSTDRFIIESSNDGRSFSSIGTQPAKGNAPGKYSFADKNPFPGINYYRLVFMNETGYKEYSKIVSAEVKNGDRFKFNVFPNPASTEVTISLSHIAGQGYVELADLTGRIIISEKVTENNTVTLSLNGLADGMYILKFHDDAHLETVKINKSR